VLLLGAEYIQVITAPVDSAASTKGCLPAKEDVSAPVDATQSG
jgi:hypothetical protein